MSDSEGPQDGPRSDEPPAATLPALDLSEPVGAIIASPAALASFCDQLTGGHGPVAIDAERASGYRYSQRAYLIQIRRSGAGTGLIDPLSAAPPRAADAGTEADLRSVNAAIGSAEWILHAATQDLPCLAEVGMRPSRLFDTELAGRLLGRERVSLAALVASELGFHLAKGHGAADWSLRPLTPAQLHYAALDVEPLSDLREALLAELIDRERWTWAEQEFAALLDFQPRVRSAEPWRRTSGLHRIRKPRQLAVVRALWDARDRSAAASDIAPGRVLPDAAIIAAAQAMPGDARALEALPEFAGRGQRRRSAQWMSAIRCALELPEDDCPPIHAPVEGPPPPRQWADRNPPAARRLTKARAGVDAAAQELGIATELLLNPSLLREVCWEPPTQTSLVDELARRGARPWQIAMVAPTIADALAG